MEKMLKKRKTSLLMDLKGENLCASCARIYEFSACRAQAAVRGNHFMSNLSKSCPEGLRL